MKTDKLEMIKGSDYKGNDDWMHYIGDECVYFFIYEGNVVTEAVLYNKTDSIRIYDFQVDYPVRRMGLGTATVYKAIITGESTSEAYSFWDNIGAIFEEEEEECFYEDEALIPFTLNIKSLY